jgi:hypothetical protein
MTGYWSGRRLPFAIIGFGLCRKLVETSTLGVLFDLFVPERRVVLDQPLGELRHLFRGELGDLGFDFLHGTHALILR